MYWLVAQGEVSDFVMYFQLWLIDWGRFGDRGWIEHEAVYEGWGYWFDEAEGGGG